MRINLMNMTEEIHAHREILVKAYPEIGIADSPVLTECEAQPGVFEVWWATSLGTFLHINIDGTRVEQDGILPEHYIEER